MTLDKSNTSQAIRKTPLTRRHVSRALACLPASLMPVTRAQSNASDIDSPTLRSESEPLTLSFRTAIGQPRAFRDTHGNWQGFEIDMTVYLLSLMNATIEYAPQHNWSRALRFMQSGGLDLLSTVSYRASRTKFLDYIGPYDIEELVVLVTKDNQHLRFDSLDHIIREDMIIQIVRDAFYTNEFHHRYETDPSFAAHFVNALNTLPETVDQAKTDRWQYLASTAKRVYAGRVTGAIIDWYSYNLIKNDPESANVIGFDPAELSGVSPTFVGMPTTYLCASRRLSQSVRDRLRTAYRQTREDDTFARLWQYWYGDRRLPPLT